MKTHKAASSHFPSVILHPLSIKSLRSGHPWILRDSYTEKFPPQHLFLSARGQGLKEEFLIFHDPHHKIIKGRVWSVFKNNIPASFDLASDLAMRLRGAFKRRKGQSFTQQRENYYLVFGEADFLPGLHILRLGKIILIQTYAFSWNNSLWDQLLSSLKTICQEFFADENFEFWHQQRNPDRKEIYTSPILGSSPPSPNITPQLEEFGIKYHLHFEHSYDYGLYTDMSEVRQQMRNLSLFRPQQRLLNLFSYTGAFSLLACSYNPREVISVDLSKKYLGWMEDNFLLNPHLDSSRHKSINLSALASLKQLLKFRAENNDEKFDLIICDPPSSSTDGKKKGQALENYKIMLPLMIQILAPKGQIVLFLNTHKISADKFSKTLLEILKTCPLPPGDKGPLKIVGQLLLGGDCPTLKNFPEGNYLKGFILRA